MSLTPGNIRGIFPHLVLLAIFAGAITLPQTAFATITNQSNEKVEIEIKRQDGSVRQHSLNPRQSIALPQDAVHLRVLKRSSFGDEVIKVKVIEPNGEASFIKKAGGELVIGEKKEGEETSLEAPQATNNGNIAVILIASVTDGSSKSIVLNPKQTAKLPKDTVQVQAKLRVTMQGDESVKVVIALVNGDKKDLLADGAVVRLDEKN